MAYIPLDSESKTKGKAAIDVICNPLGKSGGSFIQQFLIGVTGSLGAFVCKCVYGHMLLYEYLICASKLSNKTELLIRFYGSQEHTTFLNLFHSTSNRTYFFKLIP